MPFVDSHCHIDFPEFHARSDAVISAMQEAGVTHALCVSVDMENFPRVLALAERFPEVYASVGVHPDHDGGLEPDADRLVALADHPRVVATSRRRVAPASHSSFTRAPPRRTPSA
jgi:TatD DNase family protein